MIDVDDTWGFHILFLVVAAGAGTTTGVDDVVEIVLYGDFFCLLCH